MHAPWPGVYLNNLETSIIVRGYCCTQVASLLAVTRWLWLALGSDNGAKMTEVSRLLFILLVASQAATWAGWNRPTWSVFMASLIIVVCDVRHIRMWRICQMTCSCSPCYWASCGVVRTLSHTAGMALTVSQHLTIYGTHPLSSETKVPVGV